MSDGDVPGKEPGDKAPANPPPADGGAFFVSPGDWFKRHKDLSQAFKLDSYKKTVGISTRFVGSLTTSITRGHQHNTTLGFARSIVFIVENKFNLGAVFAFVRAGRDELTTGNRSEHVVGLKYERYDNDRTLHEASTATLDDVAVRSRKTKIIEQHITEIEKALAVTIKQDIKNFFDEHQKVEAILKTRETDVTKSATEVETWVENTKQFKAKVSDCQE